MKACIYINSYYVKVVMPILIIIITPYFIVLNVCEVTIYWQLLRKMMATTTCATNHNVFHQFD